AATDAQTHVAAERFGRGGVGQAGVIVAPFDAWIDDWRLHGPAADLTPLRMQARDRGFGYDLALTAEGPLVLHGDGGFSMKSERGQASYYYSQPFYRAEGRLTLDGREARVTGHAWLDREWSSQPLDPDQTGWDWFSLVFDDGRRLMLFRVRQSEGDDSIAGTWIEPDGSAAPLTAVDAALTPLGHAAVAGRRTPVRWRLRIPARGFDVEAEALNPQSWNALTVSYWEGPVRFRGSHAGRGYLEMTGY
ncbi:MAG: lipocalin family protein, partial [Rubrimonas sp.]